MEFLRKDIQYSKRIEQIFNKRPDRLVAVGICVLLIVGISLLVFLKKTSIETIYSANLVLNARSSNFAKPDSVLLSFDNNKIEKNPTLNTTIVSITLRGDYRKSIYSGSSLNIKLEELGSLFERDAVVLVNRCYFDASKKLTKITGVLTFRIAQNSKKVSFSNVPIKCSIQLRKEGFYHYIFDR